MTQGPNEAVMCIAEAVNFVSSSVLLSGVFDSVVTIYREEGILGFFA